MKDISNRADISHLVHAFYKKIRKDKILGPIFNGHIPDEQWPVHLSKLTDFWETNLLGVPRFKGNPITSHIDVDANLDYKIEPTHFGLWLQLWFETINELYEGERATKAKNSARKMSTRYYLSIWKNRPDNYPT